MWCRYTVWRAKIYTGCSSMHWCLRIFYLAFCSHSGFYQFGTFCLYPHNKQELAETLRSGYLHVRSFIHLCRSVSLQGTSHVATAIWAFTVQLTNHKFLMPEEWKVVAANVWHPNVLLRSVQSIIASTTTISQKATGEISTVVEGLMMQLRPVMKSWNDYLLKVEVSMSP